MADKIFTIPLLNGIRWTNQNIPIDDRYNTLPFDNEIDQQSYAMQWQKTDTEVPVVLLSDFPEMELNFYNSNTGAHISTFSLIATATSLLDVTFLQYMALIDFSVFPVGYCYGQITYTDDEEIVQSWISCPIDVAQKWPLTMLYQYAHSYNKNDVLFQPGDVILQLRVEANMVGGYLPGSLRESFEDQEYNATLLNGIGYRKFTNYILGAGGPDWIIDKLNLIFTCDQVKIDYEFYVATNGTDFKATRPNNSLNRDGMWEIELQSVPNFEFGQLTAGTTPTGDLVVVRKVWPLPPFANVTTSFAVNGVFIGNSTIDYMQVFNYGTDGVRDTFALLLGTTLGGNDIASLEVGTPNADTSIDLISIHDIGHGFNAATTVYVTVPDGVNIRVLFVFDQLDAPAITLTPSVGSVPQGAVGMYKELVPGYFTRDWDIASGFGQTGSEWEGYQILDEYAGKVAVGWNRLNDDVENPDGARGEEVGVPGNEVTVAKANLPNEGLNMFTAEINSTAGDTPGIADTVARARSVSGQPLNYEIIKGTIAPTLGVTAPMGAGGALYIGNDGLVTLFWVKL